MDHLSEYGKSYFWSKQDSAGRIKYYFKINKVLIEVDYEIYMLCMRSAKKLEYAEKVERKRNYRSLDNESDFAEWDYLKNQRKDAIDDLIEKEIDKALYKAIGSLRDLDKEIIIGIYFNGFSERELSKRIGVAQTTINYRKRVILKKLKAILMNETYLDEFLKKG